MRLVEQLRDVEGLTVGTLHSEMLRISGITPPSNPTRDFWEVELPGRALDTLLDGAPTEVVDAIILDETQDLATAAYLDVMDLMVTGGLAQGRTLMFGDFERQSLFGSADGRSLLRSRVPGLVVNRLTANCRNLPRIGHVVNAFSRLDPGYRRFRRMDDGADPEVVSYVAGADQSALLASAVRALRSEGYGLDEIMVLSPLREESTAETSTDPWLRQILRRADGRPSSRARLDYGTIQSFKGLEAPAVVVTDLDDHRVPNFESVMYVGLTRATDRLIALVESVTLRSLLEVPR
jgi:superfamily I DNA/RNA helicase